MECGNAVDGMASHARQVGHPNVLFIGLIDQRETGDPFSVVRIPEPQCIQKPLVDFVDDFQVTW